MSNGLDKLRASALLATTAKVGIAVVVVMLASALSGALLAIS